MFTKRRKAIRQKQEEDRKRWEKNSKKTGKSMQLMIDTAKYIDKHHPEYESLSKEERVTLFAKIYKELSKNDT
jgi:hypothetical protein